MMIMYNEQQYSELEEYIQSVCGKSVDRIFHEIQSKYIHTDVYVIESPEDIRTYITVGMSCKDMNSLDNSFKNIELMCFSTSDFDISGEDSLCIANELVSISKYPFRENTWIGNMHTINTSPDFQNRFGFDFFLFMYSGMTTNVSGVGKVDFLNIIPLYKEEREWIVKNGPEKLLLDLVEKYGEEAFTINKLRDIIIPSK